MKNLSRKIGYGIGDMGTSIFWRIFSFYLPFFYSNVVGLSLVDAGILVLVTRIWDAVSDLMIGVIADRTNTKQGKYRPYLLWFAIPFAVSGILLFSTPDFSYAGKLMWSCFTYILMMTVYTCINVPYAAMLGAITDDSREKTVYSVYRMFFAYTGSFLAMAFWEPMCSLFQSFFGRSLAGSWQWSMVIIALICSFLFVICYMMTKEVVRPKVSGSVGFELRSLFRNGPWWIMTVVALSITFFTTMRGVTIAYFFADVIGSGASMWLFGFSVLFYAGLFISVGEAMNVVGVLVTVPIVDLLGKKTTFIAANALLAVLSVMFFFVPVTAVGMSVMLLIQVLISILTGILSPLIWTMFADVSDYSELEYDTASTGLIFSSASMAQKIGGAIATAVVTWLLSACGYSPAYEFGTQPHKAVQCMWWLLSFIPALSAVVSILAMYFYSLTTSRMKYIGKSLKESRNAKVRNFSKRNVVFTDDDDDTEYIII